jgi:hypothetical protein
MDNTHKILEILEELKLKIDNIDTRLNKLENYGERMDNHITFIEYTYQSLIKPINYIKYYFSSKNSIEDSL